MVDKIRQMWDVTGGGGGGGGREGGRENISGRGGSPEVSDSQGRGPGTKGALSLSLTLFY